MNNSNTTCYISSYIEKHDIMAHVWICSSLTATECEVLELLLKGYTITQISKSRLRSIKTISFQKSQIYKKLGIRNDTTFWLELSLSPHVKMRLTREDEKLNDWPLSLLNDV